MTVLGTPIRAMQAHIHCHLRGEKKIFIDGHKTLFNVIHLLMHA